MLEPSTIVVYVDDISKSQSFYQEILGITPQMHSAAFVSFNFSNGISIGLKDKQTVYPAPDGHTGGGEIAFTVTGANHVDTIFAEWTQKGVTIPEPPNQLCFGYTFIAYDPDGNRLRVVGMIKQSDTSKDAA